MPYVHIRDFMFGLFCGVATSISCLFLHPESPSRILLPLFSRLYSVSGCCITGLCSGTFKPDLRISLFRRNFVIDRKVEASYSLCRGSFQEFPSVSWRDREGLHKEQKQKAKRLPSASSCRYSGFDGSLVLDHWVPSPDRLWGSWLDPFLLPCFSVSRSDLMCLDQWVWL